MEDPQIRAALDRHWAASDANDFDGEHQIYREDAVLEYPQSGERIRGRRNIQLSRAAQPNRKRFAVTRPSISPIRSSRGLRVRNGSRAWSELMAIFRSPPWSRRWIWPTFRTSSDAIHLFGYPVKMKSFAFTIVWQE